MKQCKNGIWVAFSGANIRNGVCYTWIKVSEKFVKILLWILFILCSIFLAWLLFIFPSFFSFALFFVPVTDEKNNWIPYSLESASSILRCLLAMRFPTIFLSCCFDDHCALQVSTDMFPFTW